MPANAGAPAEGAARLPLRWRPPRVGGPGESRILLGSDRETPPDLLLRVGGDGDVVSVGGFRRTGSLHRRHRLLLVVQDADPPADDGDVRGAASAAQYRDQGLRATHEAKRLRFLLSGSARSAANTPAAGKLQPVERPDGEVGGQELLADSHRAELRVVGANGRSVRRHSHLDVEGVVVVAALEDRSRELEEQQAEGELGLDDGDA